MATPIRRRDQLLGVLEVINKRGDPRFTELDGNVLQVVANQAAVAIENARLFEKMVQSERLSVIGRMSASIIHDLKKPMAVIRGFAEILGKPELDPEKRQAFSALILEDVDRFLDMTQELLDYSQGTIRARPEEVLLGEWLESVAPFLREEFAGFNVELALDLGYRGPVWIDVERMRRVLINIAGNAADAMPDGGVFTLATSLDDDFWELEARDTGTGILPQLRPRIFEPFVTSGKERGTGLGLAIVREIVEGHGGTIRVQSWLPGEEEGHDPGSVFCIRMPSGPLAAPEIHE
jgi:signal transduction histidine kinase